MYTSLKAVSVVHESSIQSRPQIDNSDDAQRLFRDYWKQNPGNDQENLVVACLDTQNRVQCVVLITRGTLDSSLVHAREVFKPAIIEGSSAIILSHNHPSGDITPSPEDHQVTQHLKKCGKILGIDLYDHIIYGDGTGHTHSIIHTM